MTTNIYDTMEAWKGSEVHTDNVDIGPTGDISAGKVQIAGDRWKHKRIGYAKAPYAKLLQDVDKADIIIPAENITAGDDVIKAYEIYELKAEDKIFIEDKNYSETGIILQILSPGYYDPGPPVISTGVHYWIYLTDTIDNSYNVADNLFISRLAEVHIDKDKGFVIGDLIELFDKDDEERCLTRIKDADTNGTDEDILYCNRVFRSFKENDYIATINASSAWTRHENNPIVTLQDEYPWDWAGDEVESAEFIKDMDVQFDEDDSDKELWRKHGLLFTGGREKASSQIGLMLSNDEDDNEHLSQFLGNENPLRKNPIIRHSWEMDDFENYADTTALNKIWDTSSAGLTVLMSSTGGHDGTQGMQINYDNAGEVWGLLPVPINMEVRSDETTGVNFNRIQFKASGVLGNTNGDLKLTLLAADGSCATQTFTGLLQTTSYVDYNFDFSDFDGRKYIRAVIFEPIPGSTPLSTNILLIDRVKPFMPPRWDEIVSDPTIIGKQAKNENFSRYAAYFTARERPREPLLSSISSLGQPSITVSVSSSEDFIDNDLVVLFDQDHYEIAKVSSVPGSTTMTLIHHAYAEDNTVRFEHDYDASKMAMVANNTYRNTCIGGVYLLSSDCSAWKKYITDDNVSKVLEPSTTSTDWDGGAVKEPSVRMVGNDIIMAYAGCSGSTPGSFSIGFAQSTDFVNFTKLPGNPFIEPDGTFDSVSCNHPDLHVDMPFTKVHYSGDDGSKKTIGSAIHENKINIGNTDFRVTMFIYPMSSAGFCPKDGCTLFDQGNFRIDINDDNCLSVSAMVNGEEYSTKPDIPNIENNFGNQLVMDHWNLIFAQFGRDSKIGIYNATSRPMDMRRSFFEHCPWILTADIPAGATNFTLQKSYDFIDDVIDNSGAGQECMFYSRGYETGYDEKFFTQINRITNVTDNGDNTFTCDLLNPIGEWGFTASPISGSSPYGVLLTQGLSEISGDSAFPKGLEWWRKDAFSPYFNFETRGIVNITCDLEDTGQGRSLDLNYSKPHKFGTDIDFQKAWNHGYIGFMAIDFNTLDYQTMVNIYNSLDDSASPHLPWHEFDLPDGADLTNNGSIAFYLLSSLTSSDTIIPDSANDFDMFIDGDATIVDNGFNGATLKMADRIGDSANSLLVNSAISKQNSGNLQFDVDSGWDSTDVSAPNLFKFKNQYHLGYTGNGRVLPLETGSIIGDIFETGISPVGITPSGEFFLYDGNTVSIYVSWEKKTRWYKVWETLSTGTQTMSPVFVDIPGSSPDYIYNVRWKIELSSGLGADRRSPIINSFQVEYTDPGNFPTDEFLTAQDLNNQTKIWGVELVRGDTGERIDISDKVADDGIVDITQEIPVRPDNLGNIIADDVTITCNNYDSYFTELNPLSVFYDRNITEDEIRVYSGFRLDSGDEYQIAGRYLIDYVSITSAKVAQIYCRSMLREAIDVMVGMPEDNQENPLIYAGQWKVRKLIEDLLHTYGNLPVQDMHIEDYDRYFSNITLNEVSIGEILRKLAQACNGVIYTNNQGDIYFKTWDNISPRDYDITPENNMVSARFTGQRRDRLVKECIVTGSELVQGSSRTNYTYGRTIKIDNEFLQKNEWAQTLADNTILRYNTEMRELELKSAYLPSVRILDKMSVTDTLTGLSDDEFLIYKLSKNIMEGSESYSLTSILL